jgi:hypothetical protein
MDREYMGNKRSYGLRAFIKRLTPAAAALTVSFRFRDNGASTWGSWTDFTFTSESDFTELLRVDGPMGMYHSRQWEFKMAGEPRVALVSAQEVVETSYV